MALFYKNQVPIVLVGSKSGNTRTSAALTDTFTDTTKIFETGGYAKLNLDILYTMGSAEAGNKIQLKLYSSSDRENWYQLPTESNDTGVSTLLRRSFEFLGDDAAAANISIGLDIFYKYMKIEVAESGVAANAGTAFIEGTLSGF